MQENGRMAKVVILIALLLCSIAGRATAYETSRTYGVFVAKLECGETCWSVCADAEERGLLPDWGYADSGKTVDRCKDAVLLLNGITDEDARRLRCGDEILVPSRPIHEFAEEAAAPLAARVEKLGAQYAEIASERDALAAEIYNLREEYERLTSENESLKQETAELRQVVEVARLKLGLSDDASPAEIQEVLSRRVVLGSYVSIAVPFLAALALGMILGYQIALGRRRNGDEGRSSFAPPRTMRIAVPKKSEYIEGGGCEYVDFPVESHTVVAPCGLPINAEKVWRHAHGCDTCTSYYRARGITICPQGNGGESQASGQSPSDPATSRTASLLTRH